MHSIVIADTSCLIVLEKIGRFEILRSLFQEISITREVHEEFGGVLPDLGWLPIILLINALKTKQRSSAIAFIDTSGILWKIED